MAKVTRKYSFTKGMLTKEDDGTYVMTEICKDEEKSYSLSDILDMFLNVEGFSISFGVDDSVMSDS